MSELDKALADVKSEGEPIEDVFNTDNADDTATESLPENKDEEEEPAEGDVPAEDKPTPFHEDLKVQSYIDGQVEKKEAKLREDFDREMADMKEHTTSTESESIPDWFMELYGDNQVAYNKWSEHNKTEREGIKQEILKEQADAQRFEVEQQQKWDKWVKDEIKALEDDGLEFDKNKLNKVMLKYSPTDANNNLDFRKGYEIYKLKEGEPDTAKSDAHKKLADTTTTTTTKGEPAKKDYMTSSELRGRSMNSL